MTVINWLFGLINADIVRSIAMLVGVVVLGGGLGFGLHLFAYFGIMVF